MAEDNASTGVSSQGDGATQSETSKKFEVWKDAVIGGELGLFKKEDANWSAQKKNDHFRIGGFAFDTLRSLPSCNEGEAKLALISYKKLDLHKKDYPTYEEVCRAISETKNLDFCGAGHVIRARLEYADQVMGESIHVPSVANKAGKRPMFRFESYTNALKEGRTELWILEGNSKSDRICEMEELFLVQIVDEKPEEVLPPEIIEENQPAPQPDNFDPEATVV